LTGPLQHPLDPRRRRPGLRARRRRPQQAAALLQLGAGGRAKALVFCGALLREADHGQCRLGQRGEGTLPEESRQDEHTPPRDDCAFEGFVDGAGI
jgi:hypothetical protein